MKFSNLLTTAIITAFILVGGVSFAQAASEDITQLSFTESPSEDFEVGATGHFIVQTQNSSDSEEEATTTVAVDLSDGDSGGTWYEGTVGGDCNAELSDDQITISSAENTSQKAFCYSNDTPGEYTITASVNESDSEEGTPAGITDATTDVNIVEAESASAPTLESVSPSAGAVELAADENFIWTVDADDVDGDLYSLEIDHSLEDSLDEFTVYADASNPYGNANAEQAGEIDGLDEGYSLEPAFSAAGVSVTYDDSAQEWTIDFGSTITETFIAENITFYIVLEDAEGNEFGSMSPTDASNTFAYTLSRAEVEKTVSIEDVSYDTIQDAIDEADEGDTIIVGDGTYGSISTSFSGPENVSIIAADGATPRIEGDTGRLVDLRANGTTFRGFEIHSTADGENVGISISGQNVVVEENTISNVLTGIQTNTANENGNNKVSDNVIDSENVGISLQNSNNTIVDNDVTAALEGLGIGSDSFVLSGNSITGNTFTVDAGGVSAKGYTSADVTGYQDGFVFSPADLIADNAFNNAAYVAAGSGTCGPETIKHCTIFTSIQDVIDVTTSSDSIIVAGGTYDLFDRINKNDLTLKAATGTNPVIEGNPSEGTDRLVDLSGNDITFSGFTIRNSESAQNDIGISIPGQNVTVSHNTVESVLTGIQANSGSINIQILDNKINDASHGISLISSGNTVKRNTVDATNESLGLATDGNTFEKNSFISDGRDVKNYGTATTTVASNYWGSASGPNTVEGNVNYDPYYIDANVSTLSNDESVSVATSTVQSGKATTTATSNGSSVSIDFGSNDDGAGSVTVVESNGPTGDADSETGDSNTIYLEISADTEVDDDVTISVQVATNRLSNPQEATLWHYKDGAWTGLETDASVNGAVTTLTATSKGLSPFAIVDGEEVSSGGGGGSASSRSGGGGGDDDDSDDGEVAGLQDDGGSEEDEGQVLGVQDTGASTSQQLLSLVTTQLSGIASTYAEMDEAEQLAARGEISQVLELTRQALLLILNNQFSGAGK